MNSLGLTLLFRMGCICAKETIIINNRKYHVRNRLGEGGFSYVDLVEDVHTHKLYALKRITCHSKQDERMAMQEVEYHQTLTHPYILDCFDSALHGKYDLSDNSTSQVLMLVTYHSFGTLHDELQRRIVKNAHLTEEYVLTLFNKICEGVKVMHDAKPLALAHRDIKPANILLTIDDCPVLMDLGSMGKARQEIKGTAQARMLQDLAAERCTMPYRAPELFSVESCCTIDERTDIWSLGCLLYAMCFFKSPFDATHEKGDSIALAVLSGNVDIPEDSPYSSQLHELIHSMLVVNAMERPFIDDVLQHIDKVLNESIHKV